MDATNISTASEDFLVDLCHKTAKQGGMIGGFWEGDKVAKLSDQIVVQYGMGITSSEAAVQELVYNTVDRDLVHVPKVYRFVRSDRSEDPRGYLFLEYVQGQPLEDTDLEPSGKTVRQIAGIMFRLGQIQNPVTGPLGGGLPLGYIYGDDGAKAPFTSIRDMNAYMNKRLEYRNDTIDLSTLPSGVMSRRYLPPEHYS